MGLSRTVYETDWFQSKITNFSHPRVFNAPAEGFPLELGIGARDQRTRMMGYQIVEKVLR